MYCFTNGIDHNLRYRMSVLIRVEQVGHLKLGRTIRGLAAEIVAERQCLKGSRLSFVLLFSHGNSIAGTHQCVLRVTLGSVIW